MSDRRPPTYHTKLEPTARIRRRIRGVVLLLALALAAPTGPRSLAAQAASPRQLVAEVSSRLDLAIQRYDRNEIAASVDVLRQALALNPDYAEAQVRLGEALMWLEDAEGAARAFAEARRLGYRARDLDLLEAERAVLVGELAAAGTIYDRILSSAPYQEEARVGRALLDLASGATPASYQTLEDLLRRYPRNRRLLAALVDISRQRNDMESFQRYAALLLRHHGDAPSVQLLSAEIALADGRTEDARFHAGNAVSLAPDLADAWLIMAIAAVAAGDEVMARAHYEELIRIQPRNHRAWYARGEMASRAGDLEAAELSWNRSLELRSDFEIARLALEETLLDAEPLGAPQRQEAARRYRETGRALEDRFLNRQAERQYRRGLQLNPLDPVLRRRLAELYLQRGFEARYLDQLRVIRARNLTSEETGEPMALTERDLSDRIETFASRSRTWPSIRWDVDQFSASRPRTTVRIVARQTDGTLLPGAAEHIASYVASLMLASQNVELIDTTTSAAPAPDLIARARREGADLLVIMDLDLGDRDAALRTRAIATAASTPVLDADLRRSGNSRIESLSRDAAERIDDVIEPRGTVVARDFEELLVTLGRVDGLEAGSMLRLSGGPGAPELGTAEVTAVDDLLAVARYEPQGTDNVGIGDTVLIDPEAEEEGEAAPDAASEPAAATEDAAPRPSQLRETVQRLFQVR